MSSTLAPEVLSPDNPITDQTIADLYARLPPAIAPLPLSPPQGKDLEDYTSLLQGMWEIWKDVEYMDDYVPNVDEERFPRKDVRWVERGESGNESGAWAWQCDVRDQTQKASAGLLEGKTVCLKDNMTLKGVPCLIGTSVIQDWTPSTDATVATRVLEAGGIIKGKAVCENLSLWGASCSAATGPVPNPHAAEYSVAGSSSGSAFLVATSAVDFGLGGCQGGSVRMPASAAGIVGLKPTHGLVPYTGVVSIEATLDHVGPMTRNVLGNATLLQAIAGADGIDDRSSAGCPFLSQVPAYPELLKQGVSGLRVGIIEESLDMPLHDERVSELVVKAAEALRAQGATVEKVNVPFHIEAPKLWAVIGRFSASRTMLGQATGRRGLALNEYTEKLLPLTQEKVDSMHCGGYNGIMNGLWGWENKSPAIVGKATNLIRKLKDDYLAALSKYDVLITPTLPMLPRKLPAKDAGVKELMQNAAGLTGNTCPFNLTGQPALSLPVGILPTQEVDGAKLPVGMQLVGKMYDEATIYRVAYAWETAYDWKTFD
ncbi:hypothetical protein B9479_003804 [Cryptococcus floricola]|uniref:Amidase domain-containing protein n=1 Tax=Cryptococcus floricola TaxID=2591691 RepID=A0A5D3AXF4_9TREE|nr:hypothetical protein B9479_003804 [Cryptococcus floricola]